MSTQPRGVLGPRLVRRGFLWWWSGLVLLGWASSAVVAASKACSGTLCPTNLPQEPPSLPSPETAKYYHAIQGREASASRARAAHTGQSAPKTPPKRATGLETGPRSAWEARWQVGREHCLSRNATKRHDLEIFAGHFRGRAHLFIKKKKHHLESGLYQRDEDPHEASVTQVPTSPRESSEGKSLVRWCARRGRVVVLLCLVSNRKNRYHFPITNFEAALYVGARSSR